MRKLLLLLLLLPFYLNAQVVSDAVIKSNTNTLIRNANPVLRASHSMINDQLTDSKMSRVENNQISGTNTYYISLAWVNSYSKGLTIPGFFTNGNTGSSTINVNLLGSIPIQIKGIGLSGGEIQPNIPYTLIYDGSNFQLNGGIVGYSGVANRISITSSSIDIASSYIGQSSITTLGTIVTGTWNSVRLTAPYVPQGSANSIWGVAGSSISDQSSIVAGLDGQILRRNGATLGFGSIDLSNSNTVGVSILGTANGGTGTSTPNLVAGSNVTITGTWPNQTINSTGGSGISGLTTDYLPIATSATTLGNSVIKKSSATNYYTDFSNNGNTQFAVVNSTSGSAANAILAVQAGTAFGQIIEYSQGHVSKANILEIISNGNIFMTPLSGVWLPHLAGSSSTPGISAGVGAGTSPTVSITGTDLSGFITVTTGTTPTISATIVTITFASSYWSTPKTVLLDPANSNAALLSGVTEPFVDQADISTTIFKLTAGTTALTGSTTYKWYYTIIQ